MRTQKDMVENIRKGGIGQELRDKEYIEEENELMGKIFEIEEKLAATLNEEQAKLYELLDSYIWDYVEAAQKDAFFYGYSLARVLLNDAR